MAFAPAEPMGRSSASSAAATARAAGGLRVRLVTTRTGPSCAEGSPVDGFALSTRSRAGRATALVVMCPSRARAMCTAQSVRPSSPNSRVPSSGSTIQTRRDESRSERSAASSERMGSSGRAVVNRSQMSWLARRSPAPRRASGWLNPSEARSAISSAPASPATWAARASSSREVKRGVVTSSTVHGGGSAVVHRSVARFGNLVRSTRRFPLRRMRRASSCPT